MKVRVGDDVRLTGRVSEVRSPAAGTIATATERDPRAAIATVPRAPSRRPPPSPVVPSSVVASEQLLQRLAALRHGLFLPLARAAAALSAQSAWFACGYRNTEDFARERLGRSARWFQDLVRLQKVLDKLPRLAAAISGVDGGESLGQMAALAMGRVATPADVELWIVRARNCTLAALRQAVAKAVAGDGIHRISNEDPTAATGPPVRLRFRLPPEVRAAHDAMLEQHRAVVGWDAGLASFADAMIGEATSAGWAPPDDFHARFWRPSGRMSPGPRLRPGVVANVAPHRPVGPRGRIPSTSAVAVSPAARRALRTLADFDRMQERVRSLLHDLEASNSDAETSGQRSPPKQSSVRRLVGALRGLIRFQNSLEIATGDLLLDMHEHRAWPLLGFGGLEDYAEERLGLGRSTARSRVSLARQLRRRPAVQEAYEAGQLSATAAHWLGRMQSLAPEVQERWIEHASTTTVKRLRDEERLLRRQQLLARAAVAQFMTPRPALKAARRFPNAATLGAARGQVAEPVDDAAWQASLLRVPGKTQEWLFRMGHQLCERVAWNGPLLPEDLDLFLPLECATSVQGCVEAVRRELTARAASPLPPAPESRQRPSARMAATFVERGERVPEWVAYLALLEECACVWDLPEGKRKRRAAQALERDGYRCMAPGCAARCQLHVHHVRYRSAGGGNEPENTVVLCLFHHMQGEHGGLARCRGRAPLDLIWCLGCGELGTWWRNERRLQAPA